MAHKVEHNFYSWNTQKLTKGAYVNNKQKKNKSKFYIVIELPCSPA